MGARSRWRSPASYSSSGSTVPAFVLANCRWHRLVAVERSGASTIADHGDRAAWPRRFWSMWHLRWSVSRIRHSFNLEHVASSVRAAAVVLRSLGVAAAARLLARWHRGCMEHCVNPRTPRRRRSCAARTRTRRSRPQRLADFIGQAKARANLKIFVEAAQRAWRGARPRALRRAAGPRQDDARADRRARARRELPRHLRPGHRQGGRPRGAPHQSRRPRRPLHRRDPSAVAGGRGNPLSGDGGVSARPDHRRGAGGALGPDRPVALHAGRRDDAARASDHAAARPLRHSDPARFLLPTRSWRRSCAAARASSARRSPMPARARSRAARAARRASPGGCFAACAISRLPTAPTAITDALADKALLALEVDAHGLDSLDRRYLIDDRRKLLRRAGRDRDDLGGACPSRATRSRISSSPT